MEVAKDLFWFKQEIEPQLHNYEVSYRYFKQGDFGSLNQVSFEGRDKGGSNSNSTYKLYQRKKTYIKENSMGNFTDDLNTAVFTTKYVIHQSSVILHVYHYEDGSWQFNGNEKNLEDVDYKVVSLGEILAIDKTLSEVGDIPLGFEAIRRTSGE
jgi:hypothetical protein